MLVRTGNYNSQAAGLFWCLVARNGSHLVCLLRNIRCRSSFASCLLVFFIVLFLVRKAISEHIFMTLGSYYRTTFIFNGLTIGRRFYLYTRHQETRNKTAKCLADPSLRNKPLPNFTRRGSEVSSKATDRPWVLVLTLKTAHMCLYKTTS